MAINEFDFGGDAIDFGAFGEEDNTESLFTNSFHQETENSVFLQNLEADTEKMISQLTAGTGTDLFENFCEYFRNKCQKLGINLEQDVEKHLNLIISEVVKKVNESNNIHLDVTSENFEKEINKAL